jgi:2-phosphoglycolate phosphatase
MKTPKVRLVIFDLDGTLVDAYKAVAESINYMLQQIGCPPADEEKIKRSVGWGMRPLIVTFAGEEKADEAVSIYRQHHARALKSGTAFLPGAQELLYRLKKKRYKLAIASNRPARFTHIILKHLKVAALFDHVLCGDEISDPKPSPVMLQQILRKFALSPEEALYVGDMTIDVQTGHAAGVRTVTVITGSSDREEIARLKPLKIMEHISEVEEILAQDGAWAEGVNKKVCC